MKRQRETIEERKEKEKKRIKRDNREVQFSIRSRAKRFYHAECVVCSRMSVESEKKLDWSGGKTVELPRTAAHARQRGLHSGK